MSLKNINQDQLTRLIDIIASLDKLISDFSQEMDYLDTRASERSTTLLDRLKTIKEEIVLSINTGMANNITKLSELQSGIDWYRNPITNISGGKSLNDVVTALSTIHGNKSLNDVMGGKSIASLGNGKTLLDIVEGLQGVQSAVEDIESVEEFAAQGIRKLVEKLAPDLAPTLKPKIYDFPPAHGGWMYDQQDLAGRFAFEIGPYNYDCIVEGNFLTADITYIITTGKLEVKRTCGTMEDGQVWEAFTLFHYRTVPAMHAIDGETSVKVNLGTIDLMDFHKKIFTPTVAQALSPNVSVTLLESPVPYFKEFHTHYFPAISLKAGDTLAFFADRSQPITGQTHMMIRLRVDPQPYRYPRL